MLTGSVRPVATRSTRKPGCRTAQGTGGSVTAAVKSGVAPGAPPLGSVKAAPISEIHHAAVAPAVSVVSGRYTSRSVPPPSVKVTTVAGSVTATPPAERITRSAACDARPGGFSGPAAPPPFVQRRSVSPAASSTSDGAGSPAGSKTSAPAPSRQRGAAIDATSESTSGSGCVTASVLKRRDDQSLQVPSGGGSLP